MKTILVLMFIALAALIGVNFHFQRELEAGRQQIGVLTSQAHESQAATVASPVKTPEQTPAQPPPVADQAPQQVASPDNPVRSGPSRPSIASVLAQMQTPERQARIRADRRRTLESSLPDIEQVLDLTTAEKDKLVDLLAMLDTRGITESAPEHESAQEREERYQRWYDTRVAELQALLGSKYPRWQDYEDTVSVRREERDLLVALDAAGIPLAQTQERALVDALVEVQRGFNLTDRTPTGVVIRRTPENIQLLVSAATPYLSKQQLDEYRALLERRRAIIEGLRLSEPRH